MWRCDELLPFEHDGGVEATAVEEEASVECSLVSLERGNFEILGSGVHGDGGKRGKRCNGRATKREEDA